jgi:hypothetical protein
MLGRGGVTMDGIDCMDGPPSIGERRRSNEGQRAGAADGEKRRQLPEPGWFWATRRAPDAQNTRQERVAWIGRGGLFDGSLLAR